MGDCAITLTYPISPLFYVWIIARLCSFLKLPNFPLKKHNPQVEKGYRQSLLFTKSMILTYFHFLYCARASRGEKSMYLIEGSERIKDLVSDLAADLMNDESPADHQLMKLCRTCQAIRSDGLICELHKKVMPSLKELPICACSLGLVD